MISWFWFERKRSKKMGGKGGKSKYKNYEGAIYHFGGRDTRSKSTLRRVIPFHPLGTFTIGTFFSALSPSPPRFFSSTTANWCMARDWSDCTHTKGIPLPSSLLPEGEGWRQPRHPVGKTPCSLGSRKTVHAVSPNSARACSLIDFSAGSVPPAGHTSLFPPLHSTLLQLRSFSPRSLHGGLLCPMKFATRFFFLSPFFLFLSFSLSLASFWDSFFLSWKFESIPISIFVEIFFLKMDWLEMLYIVCVFNRISVNDKYRVYFNFESMYVRGIIDALILLCRVEEERFRNIHVTDGNISTNDFS